MKIKREYHVFFQFCKLVHHVKELQVVLKFSKYDILYNTYSKLLKRTAETVKMDFYQ